MEILSLRDERGLLKSADYKFTPEGLVDYTAMLKREHLYVLAENEEKVKKAYGKPSKELDLTQIEKKYVCILLSGIRYLANLRGFSSVKQSVASSNYDTRFNLMAGCTCSCEITWIGNFESEMRPVIYTDVAGASLANCDKFVQRYVETIAANRAFVRAVRGFLGVNIVGKDEIGGEQVEINTSATTISKYGNDPTDALAMKLKEKGWTFSQLQNAICKKYKDRMSSDPEKWKNVESISSGDAFSILGLIRNIET